MIRVWHADIPITIDLARKLLAEQFPSLAPFRCKVLGEGWDNTVFLVNDTYVFRFPRRKSAVECMQAEIGVLPKLEPLLPLTIPKLSFVGKPSSLYPYLFSGYKMLSGNPVHTSNATEQDRQFAAKPLAEFLQRLHSIPLEQAVGFGVKPDMIGRMDLNRRVSQFKEYLQEAVQQGLVKDPAPFEEAIRSLQCASSLRKRTSLVHGDLNFRNFLLDSHGNISGIIDWGDVHIGHPAVDLSVAFSFLPVCARSVFQEAYGEIDEETWQLAKFRALYTNLYILVYANDIGDDRQKQEASFALELALIEFCH